MSPRAAANLVSLVLLAAGCSDVRLERPAAEASATPSVTSVPVSPGPSPTKSAQPPRRLTLLPTGCRDGQLVVGRRWHGDGATGTSLLWTRVRVVAGRACLMRGAPGVRLLDSGGRPIELTSERAPHHAAPIVLTARNPATVMIGKYRCDIASSRRRTATALITLPGLHRVRRLPTRGALPLCAPRDPSHSLLVLPLTTNSHDLHPPYAVSAGSTVIRHPSATWSRADLDGDGRLETVVVRRTGDVTVRAGGARSTIHVPLGGPVFLQGLSDLDGDGRAEALLATTASGCCGARPTNVSTTVARFVEGRLVVLRGTLQFNRGSGEVFAGVRCGVETFDQTLAGRAGQDDTATVVVTTYRLTRSRVGTVSVTRRAYPALSSAAVAAIDATATHCPGLGADGWAVR